MAIISGTIFKSCDRKEIEYKIQVTFTRDKYDYIRRKVFNDMDEVDIFSFSNREKNRNIIYINYINYIYIIYYTYDIVYYKCMIFKEIAR